MVRLFRGIILRVSLCLLLCSNGSSHVREASLRRGLGTHHDSSKGVFKNGNKPYMKQRMMMMNSAGHSSNVEDQVDDFFYEEYSEAHYDAYHDTKSKASKSKAKSKKGGEKSGYQKAEGKKSKMKKAGKSPKSASGKAISGKSKNKKKSKYSNEGGPSMGVTDNPEATQTPSSAPRRPDFGGGPTERPVVPTTMNTPAPTASPVFGSTTAPPTLSPVTPPTAFSAMPSDFPTSLSTEAGFDMTPPPTMTYFPSGNPSRTMYPTKSPAPSFGGRASSSSVITLTPYTLTFDIARDNVPMDEEFSSAAGEIVAFVDAFFMTRYNADDTVILDETATFYGDSVFTAISGAEMTFRTEVSFQDDGRIPDLAELDTALNEAFTGANLMIMIDMLMNLPAPNVFTTTTDIQKESSDGIEVQLSARVAARRALNGMRMYAAAAVGVLGVLAFGSLKLRGGLTGDYLSKSAGSRMGKRCFKKKGSYYGGEDIILISGYGNDAWGENMTGSVSSVDS